jgi:hypothetical protein
MGESMSRTPGVMVMKCEATIDVEEGGEEARHDDTTSNNNDHSV